MAEPAKRLADLDINKAEDWARIQARWAKERFDKVQAQADKFFTADEELPLSQHLLLSIIALFFVLFVIWANFATLDQVTRGPGKVIPSGEIQVLSSLEGGIIDEFLVREGDDVTGGQALIRLRDIQASADFGVNQKRYLGLQAKIARLKAEAEGEEAPTFSDEIKTGAPESVKEEMDAFRANQRNQESQLQILEQQREQRQQELKGLESRIGDLGGVLSLARQQRNMTAPLVERGSAPKMELIQLDRDIKERESELNSAQSALPRIKASIEEADARIKELKSAAQAQAQTDLAAAVSEVNALQQTLNALADRKSRTEIRSPVNGTVKDIKISTVGGVVQPGQAIIEIVPRDDQLLIEASVRPSDIAFLYPGQKAVVKITAYDYAIYGGLNGEVVDISADTITNEKGESFYRVRIRTAETSLKRKGEVLRIIPGMVASVDILTGKRTVMEYLMKPFIKTLTSAMNER